MATASSNYVVPGANPFNQSDVTVAAGPGIAVTESPQNNYVVSTNGKILQTVVKTLGPINQTIASGGSPINLGNITGLPAIDPSINPFIICSLTMSLTMSSANFNLFNVGVYSALSQRIVQFNTPNESFLNFNWGTSIPNPANKVVTNFIVPYAMLYTGIPYFGVFINYPRGLYTLNNLNFSLSINYYV
jgi:hypothetical protein